MSLVNIATGALLAKDLFGSKGRAGTKARGTKAKKGLGTFGKIVLAIGGAYVANKLLANFSKSNVEDQAGNGTKDGNAAAYAIRLYDAMFGGWFFGLGTNDEEIAAVAMAIKAEKLNALVIEKYRTLYKSSLNTDLQKEGVFVAYYTIIDGVTPTPTQNGGTNTRTIKVGDTIYGYAGWNVRNINGALIRASIANEVWQVTGLKNETIAGTTGVWVRVKKKEVYSVTEYKVFYKGLYYK